MGAYGSARGQTGSIWSKLPHRHLFRSTMHVKQQQQIRLLQCVLTTIVALACAVLGSAPACALDPAKSLQQYVIRTWTTEQGLPQNSIHAMLQSRDGFLWIGTQGGLARFDGADFVLYKSETPNSVPGESITGLIEDRDQTLWISSDGGLTQFRDGRFVTYGKRNGLPDTSIWRITSAARGGVWAVTRQSQLFHFEGGRVRNYAMPFLGRPEEVNALLEDHAGTLWIATFHGLFALKPEGKLLSFNRQDGLAGAGVYAMALDRRGELWTAGDGGLSHLSTGGFVRFAVPGLATATLLAFDQSTKEDGTLWTGSTGQGLFRFRSSGTQRLQAAQGLLSDEIYLLYASRDGSLWVGALDGLNQLTDGAVTSHRTGEGLPKSTLGMQRSQGADHDLWFGHDDHMAHVRNSTLAPLGPVHAGLEAISLWVHSNERNSRGLVLTDSAGHSVLTDGTGLRKLPHIQWNLVGSVLITRDGTLWTSGSEIGVISYPAQGPVRTYDIASGLDSNNVLSLAEDRAGDVWVGTLSGLNRIGHGVVTHVVSSAKVTSINPSADGSLWASSESGLIYVPASLSPVRVFTQREGLPTSLIQGLAEDADGHLWLGTEQGIVRVEKAELLRPDPATDRSPVVFGVADGLRNAQVRSNSVFRSRLGDIWFVTLQEIASIDPHKMIAKQLAPVVIDRVAVDDQDAALNPPGSFVVPAGRHRLTLHYTLPEFRIPGRIRFRYRLVGWDKGWVQAGAVRSATYTGIPPGKYTFQVDHSDGYGNWSTGDSTLSVRVTPYFHQTGWFFALVGMFLMACIWQLHRFRVAQVSAGMHARMQERTRIARELHDTLLQGMLGISMQMYAASQKPLDPASLTTMLDHASQRLRDIAEQGRRAVEDLRSPSPSPDTLEATLERTVREMDLPTGMQHYVRSSGSAMALRPLVRAELEQITREAVANAVKHSGASSICLDVLYQSSHFFLSVSDNGCGIQQTKPRLSDPGHWGITGMQERAKSIGGRLRLLTNAPHGTVVEISLRGTTAYASPPRDPATPLWRQRLQGWLRPHPSHSGTEPRRQSE